MLWIKNHIKCFIPIDVIYQYFVIYGKLGTLAQARALYDHTIDRMSYIKYGEGWGKGDAVYACDSRTGNCTDFHRVTAQISTPILLL